MKIKCLKQFTSVLIFILLLSQQNCFAEKIRAHNICTRQNLAPVLNIKAEAFKNYFAEEITFEKVQAEANNRFVQIIEAIKEDKELLYLLDKLNKLGQLNEKETILSLLVMANGVKMPVVKLMGISAGNFYYKLKKYEIKDNFFEQVNARDIFIKTGLAQLREDGTLYIEMGKMPCGLSKQLMRALGAKLIVKHKLYDTGQLGRFEGVNYKFKNRSNEEIEVTVEYGYITKIKFLSDNKYADKFALIYNRLGQLIDSTRRLGVKIKELKNNTVILALNKSGAIPVAEATGARLKWGKTYTHYDGRKIDLAGKQVRLTVQNGVVVKAVLVEDDIELALNVVYEADTHLPVYCSVARITQERMAGFQDHYVLGRLSSSGTLEAGGKTWCTLFDYPNFRIKYFINKGWISDVEVYDAQNILKRTKAIHLVYDNQGKPVDFLRKMTLEEIAKLEDHTIDYTLTREVLYIANEKDEQMPGVNGRIFLQKILPRDAQYPIEGRLVVKNGIIVSFECELAQTDHFYYALESDTKKVLFYFNGMGKDLFRQLDNITIVKKVTKSTDTGVLKLGAGSVYIKFPQWAVGSWVMFDIKKGRAPRQVTFLSSKDHKDILLTNKGKPVIYKKNRKTKRWQLSCAFKSLPEQIRKHAENLERQKETAPKRKRAPKRYISKQARKEALAQAEKREEQFLLKSSNVFFGADRLIFISLYQSSKKKGFNLESMNQTDNLIRMLRFASSFFPEKDAQIEKLKNILMDNLSFLGKAKLLLNETEQEIFTGMFIQIRTIYTDHKKGAFDKVEALRRAQDVLDECRERFAAYNHSIIEEKVFISFLASRLMGIFFAAEKASFDEVQHKLKEFNVELIDFNDPEFISNKDKLASLKKLNEELNVMGWEIRFMKSDANHKAKKEGTHNLSIDMIIEIAEFLKENNMDFYDVRNGKLKTLDNKERKRFKEKFGFKWRQLLFQSIIGNLRAVEASEQKISAYVFNKWFRGLTGLKKQLVEYKKAEVLENLNLIFDKGFQRDTRGIIDSLCKEVEISRDGDTYIEEAI